MIAGNPRTQIRHNKTVMPVRIVPLFNKFRIFPKTVLILLFPKTLPQTVSRIFYVLSQINDGTGGSL